MLKSFKNFILDTLFPISCLSCGVRDAWLCPECFNQIGILTMQVCPYCEKAETPAGAICPRCKARAIEKNSPLALNNLIVATRYTRNNLARLVHVFKYNFVPDLGVPLARLVAQAILENHLPLPDFIVSVPLHPRRLRWRGFNQAAILAAYLAENLSPGLTIPVLDATVIRRIFTPPQMTIKNYAARKKNMQNSFSLGKKYSLEENIIKNKKILLIDDIATTGSTLLECAKVLKAAGAKKVFASVIARQEMP